MSGSRSQERTTSLLLLVLGLLGVVGVMAVLWLWPEPTADPADLIAKFGVAFNQERVKRGLARLPLLWTAKYEPEYHIIDWKGKNNDDNASDSPRLALKSIHLLGDRPIYEEEAYWNYPQAGRKAGHLALRFDYGAYEGGGWDAWAGTYNPPDDSAGRSLTGEEAFKLLRENGIVHPSDPANRACRVLRADVGHHHRGG